MTVDSKPQDASPFPPGTAGNPFPPGPGNPEPPIPAGPVSSAMSHLAANWKTTASSMLTVTLVTTAALLTYPPIQQHPQWVLVLGGVQIVGKAWIGLIQVDAKPPTP